MADLIVVTHPEVTVDPAVPVPDWGLSDLGQARAQRFALSGEMEAVTRLCASTETKARETAAILAAPRALPLSVDPRLGENDRSATGFLRPEVFEAATDAFFATPAESHRGWETALAAQARIVQAVRELTAALDGGDVAIVTHGAVGTLLYCHLMGLPIDRRHDQPGQGHYWRADLDTLRPRHGWRPL